MSEEKMREAFESYAAGQGVADFELNEFGSYKNHSTNMKYWYWKMGCEFCRQSSVQYVYYTVDVSPPTDNEQRAAPQYAQAIETAEIMKCVEVCKRIANSDAAKKPEVISAFDCYESLLALIPQDGRTQLEEFGMKVANEIAEHYGYSLLTEKALNAIVTNLIGAAK